MTLAAFSEALSKLSALSDSLRQIFLRSAEAQDDAGRQSLFDRIEEFNGLMVELQTVVATTVKDVEEATQAFSRQITKLERAADEESDHEHELQSADALLAAAK